MSSPASDCVFTTPELFEEILLFIVAWPDDIHERDDPRSGKTIDRGIRMRTLLHCQQVNKAFHDVIRDSKRIQRALFLQPDSRTARSWLHPGHRVLFLPASTAETRSTAPVLNPLIQVTFPTYIFRFWHLSLDMMSDKRYCAYLIITRRDMDAIRLNRTMAHGRSLSRMLLSQPPCTALEATIWEERDETKDYVGRTTSLREPVIRKPDGLTMGCVCERVGEMFEEHTDVAAIKLTTA